MPGKCLTDIIGAFLHQLVILVGLVADPSLNIFSPMTQPLPYPYVLVTDVLISQSGRRTWPDAH